MARYYDITIDGDGGIMQVEAGATVQFISASKLKGQVDLDPSFTLNSGNFNLGASVSMIFVTGSTFKGVADLGSGLTLGGGTLNIAADGVLNFVTGSKLKGTADLDTGLTLAGGDLNIAPGVTVHLQTVSFLEVQASSHIDVKSLGQIDIEDGGSIDIEDGGQIDVESGGLLNFQTGGLLAGLVEGDFSFITKKDFTSSDYRLIASYEEDGGSGTGKSRWYLSNKSGSENTLVYTRNAVYQQATGWSKDVESQAAIRIDYWGPSTTSSIGHTGTYLIDDLASSPWADTIWGGAYGNSATNAIELGFKGEGGDNTCAFLRMKSAAADQVLNGTAPLANTLYGASIPKAWGAFTRATGSGGSVTWVGDRFNISSITWVDSNNLQVNFDTDMEDGDYQVITSGAFAAATGIAIPRVNSSAVTADYFYLQFLRETGALLDLATYPVGYAVRFLVLGTQ